MKNLNCFIKYPWICQSKVNLFIRILTWTGHPMTTSIYHNGRTFIFLPWPFLKNKVQQSFYIMFVDLTFRPPHVSTIQSPLNYPNSFLRATFLSSSHFESVPIYLQKFLPNQDFLIATITRLKIFTEIQNTHISTHFYMVRWFG